MSLDLIKREPLALIQTLALVDKISLDADALAVRDEMLEDARKACPAIITSPAEQRTVKEYAVELNQWLKEVEDNQDAINQILLPLQRKSRRLTDEASAPVKALLAKLKMNLTGFTLREEERVKREEAERQKKIADAAAETDRLKREAEEAALKLASNFATDEDLEKAVALEKEVEQAQEKERTAIIARPVEVSRQAGLVGGRRKQWALDENDPKAIHKLYAARPELVRLTPNASAIVATVFPEDCPPGLKCWWERKTDIRSS